ncbi:MAG: ferritin family protein [Chitinispirillaceae bacterium]|nr:ferritin family protein [Chitinispirillaceae bacterium]
MDALELTRIFSIATQRELEANTFYTRVAKAADNPDVKTVFEQLAREEMGHFELLERLRNDPTMPMKIAAPKQDYKLAEATELPQLSDIKEPREAIALAMKKEQQAVEFYRDLSASTGDAQIQDIFTNLANMELGHKHRLETVFVDIGYPEAF